MCLVTLALDIDRRFPLVLAANRDEYFDRPAARLAWWTPPDGLHPVLSGRDLASGGAWMGLTAAGRLAFVTNVRDPLRMDAGAPSRGAIVLEWLAAREAPDRFWMRTALTGYNGFNLIAADFRRGECFWASNRAINPQRLERGLYGVSNGLLDTPWPKVEVLKQRVREAIGTSRSVDNLSVALFDALADRTPAPDADLPDTGVAPEWEKALSAAFIRTPDGRYGTRCSTLVIVERTARGPVTHVLERTFAATDGLALLRRSLLKNWPPRYDADPTGDGEAPATQGPVHEVELAADVTPAPVRRTRVRSLLKPTGKR